MTDTALAPTTAPTTSSFVALAPQQWQMAENLAKADIIPKDFRGKPANIFVCLEMAHRLGIGPMEAMQNLYVVHGTPSMSAKFLIALANRSGRFRGGLRFEEHGEGESLRVVCYAIDRETGDRLEASASMQQAVKAGWKNNKKYDEMPAQMLSYRAATFFVRRYCPEVAMGMATVEEAQAMPEPRDAAADPLERALAPIDPPATEEPATVDAEPVEYLPAARAEKLIASFVDKGVPYEEVLDRLGDPEKVTPAIYDEMSAWYKSLPKPEPVDPTPEAPATDEAPF